MKRTSIKIAVLLPLLCLLFCAFKIEPDSSVKTLTKPYITTYECVTARLGNENLMDKFDRITITFLDDEELEVRLTRKSGKSKCHRCNYVYDEKDHTFSAELGIFGFTVRQEAKIENGKFTICMPILGKTLLMNFQA